MQGYDATAWTIPGCPVFSIKVVHRSKVQFAEWRSCSHVTFAGQPGKLSVPAGTTLVLQAHSAPQGCDHSHRPLSAPHPSPQPWWYGYTWWAQNEDEQTWGKNILARLSCQLPYSASPLNSSRVHSLQCIIWYWTSRLESTSSIFKNTSTNIDLSKHWQFSKYSLALAKAGFREMWRCILQPRSNSKLMTKWTSCKLQDPLWKVPTAIKHHNASPFPAQLRRAGLLQCLNSFLPAQPCCSPSAQAGCRCPPGTQGCTHGS